WLVGSSSRTVAGGIPASSPHGWVYGVSWKMTPQATPAHQNRLSKRHSWLTRSSTGKLTTLSLLFALSAAEQRPTERFLCAQWFTPVLLTPSPTGILIWWSGPVDYSTAWWWRWPTAAARNPFLLWK